MTFHEKLVRAMEDTSSSYGSTAMKIYSKKHDAIIKNLRRWKKYNSNLNPLVAKLSLPLVTLKKVATPKYFKINPKHTDFLDNKHPCKRRSRSSLNWASTDLAKRIIYKVIDSQNSQNSSQKSPDLSLNEEYSYS
jgi:hypothetical protein